MATRPYRSGHFQAQRAHGFWIQRRLAIFLDCHPEAVGVVPHGPPKVVVFEREPRVADPCVTVLRLGVPKNAEFVAYYRDAVLLRPIRDLVDLGLDVRGIPMILPITNHVQPVHGFRDGRRDFVCIVGIRRLMKVLQPMPVESSPGRSLMGEDVRLVKMKNIDHIGIPQRLEKEQIIIVIPTRSGG